MTKVIVIAHDNLYPIWQKCGMIIIKKKKEKRQESILWKWMWLNN